MTELVDAFFENPAFLSALSAWQAVAKQQAMFTYNEPILPGMTINIDSNNSSSPETERDVLQMASYGKQIGRISDAVAKLIARDPADQQPEYAEFAEMKREVDDVKQKALKRRAERMAADVALLKLTDKKQFAAVKKALLAVL